MEGELRKGNEERVKSKANTDTNMHNNSQIKIVPQAETGGDVEAGTSGT
jgi:hypothetical protein